MADTLTPAMDSGLRCNLDGAIGGTYRLPDGREFWVDGATVREVLRRIEPVIVNWLEAHTRTIDDAPDARPDVVERVARAGNELLCLASNGRPGLIAEAVKEWEDAIAALSSQPSQDGEAMRAIDFALDVVDPPDAVVFLLAWREGRLEEWPEFAPFSRGQP